MKLHLTAIPDQYMVTAYGAGYVTVNGQRHDKSLVLTPTRVIENWEVAAFEDLRPAHFAFLAGLNAEIVLLGTGAALKFPHPRLSAPLTGARIGLEVMDTSAACRTYNILMSEGRKVAAALILDAAAPAIGRS